jgi:plastocyanin
MQRTRGAILVPAAVLVVAMAGCGGSGSSSSGTSTTRHSGSSGGAVGAQAAPGSSNKATTIPANAAGAGSFTTLNVAADPTGQLKFDTSSLTAKEGTLTINFTNRASIGHNFTIERDGKVVAATPTFQGGTKTLKVGLSPGTYTFLCTVPGHAAAGMKGTLTIS